MENELAILNDGEEGDNEFVEYEDDLSTHSPSAPPAELQVKPKLRWVVPLKLKTFKGQSNKIFDHHFFIIKTCRDH